MDTHNNHKHPEINPSVQELAGMMDLDLSKDDPVSEIHHTEHSEEFDSEEYFTESETETHLVSTDVINDEEFNPEKNRTKVSLQNNGMAKAALVSGASLAAILGGAMIFQGQLPKEQVAQVINKKEPVDDKVSSAQAAASKAQQSESETKAQLALSKQKDSLAQSQTPDAGKTTPNLSTATDKIAIAKVNPTTPAPIVVAPVGRNRSNSFTPAAPSFQPVSHPAPRKIPSLAQPERSSIAKTQKSDTANTVVPAKLKSRAPEASIAQLRPVNKVQPEVLIASSKTYEKPMTKALTSPGVSAPLTNSPATRSPVTNPAPSNPIDANAELQQLAAAGRYGMVTGGVEVSNPPVAEAKPSGTNGSGLSLAMGNNAPPLSQYFQRNNATEPTLMASNITSNNSESRGARTAFANSQDILRGNSDTKSGEKDSIVVKNSPATNTNNIADASPQIRTLLVGTSAKGSAVTPVLWGAGTNSTAKFLLKLDEPMLDGNNRQAFPAGTQFVVTAKSASSTIGLAELEVVSVIINGVEFTPPSGAIVIRDNQGGLLIGEDYFKRDEQIANRDMLSVFTGALGGLGRILNQPISTVSSSVNGGVVNTTNVTTNREPNILGAVLEGGAKDISAVWSQRNQQAIQELAGKPNVYQLPKGRSVRVFINQSMSF
jgi:Bacterial conjugation TrbI-like protein